jgi:Holliday junction DNA helicase RuvA
MIGRLRGRLATKAPSLVLIDVGGVGFEASISLSTFARLPAEGGEVTLAVVTVLRENAIELFAFADTAERDAFTLLRTVNGVGPRLALAILSGIEPAELAAVLTAGTISRLVAIPGVGRKTAERLVVELKDRIQAVAGPSTAPADSIEDDAVAALLGLGYKAAEASRAVRAARQGGADALEAVIKKALAALA